MFLSRCNHGVLSGLPRAPLRFRPSAARSLCGIGSVLSIGGIILGGCMCTVPPPLRFALHVGADLAPLSCSCGGRAVSICKRSRDISKSVVCYETSASHRDSLNCDLHANMRGELGMIGKCVV